MFLKQLLNIQKNIFNFHRDLPFLPEKKKIGKCNKLICDFHYKKTVFYIRILKQALNHGLILRKVHKVIQVDKKAWLKTYIGINN